MQIPTIKTLITYISRTETKRVLCDIQKGDDKYASIEYEQAILNRCPFLEDNYYHEEIYDRLYGRYEIVVYNRNEPVDTFHVEVVDVLECNGRIYRLQEEQYDMKEFDY
jgi:hypothetical protein